MASLDWLKLTRQRALSLKKHNGQRERLEYNHSNPDIDKSKTDQNYCIGCADYDDAVDAMIKRVKEVDELYPQKTKSERKDRKVAVSIETKCPQEIYDSGRSREFFEKTHQLLSDFFSAENNLGSCVHLDEMHPYLDKDGTEKMSLAHMTTLIAAYTEWKEKNGEVRRGISASKLESRANLQKLNKLMCDMVRREFGIEYNTGEQARHATVEHLKAESKLAELKKAVNEKKEDLELITQAGDKAFAELNKNLDEAKSIGVQQLKEITEEIEEKQATLKDLDTQIIDAVEIPPRPQLPAPLPPDEPRPMREHRGYTREEEKALVKEQKVWDKSHAKGGERWNAEQQHKAQTEQALQKCAEWDAQHHPIAAAKNAIAKAADKIAEAEAAKRQALQMQQQAQAELERGRAELERGKRANDKRTRELDIEVGRRVQEELARTDKYQRFMAASAEFDKRLEMLYKGADKRNQKAFEEKVKAMQKKGVER